MMSEIPHHTRARMLRGCLHQAAGLRRFTRSLGWCTSVSNGDLDTGVQIPADSLSPYILELIGKFDISPWKAVADSTSPARPLASVVRVVLCFPLLR